MEIDSKSERQKPMDNTGLSNPLTEDRHSRYKLHHKEIMSQIRNRSLLYRFLVPHQDSQ